MIAVLSGGGAALAFGFALASLVAIITLDSLAHWRRERRDARRRTQARPRFLEDSTMIALGLFGLTFPVRSPWRASRSSGRWSFATGGSRLSGPRSATGA